jgi:diguanylate cyclase (GGDEF)-like protein/PAS domain S-box-containing protein
MSDLLRILLLEDSLDDAQLILLNLEQQGVYNDCQRVETEAAYIAALDSHPDLIIADYILPQFDGLSALKLAREQLADIPFIFISGTFGEKVVAGALDLGANDFLMKDRLVRLGQSIQKVLEQKRLRDEKRRADAALIESERHLRSMMENMHLAAIMLDIHGNISFCNDYLLQITGWEQNEVLGQNWFDVFIPGELQAVQQMFLEAMESGALPVHYENPILTKSGEVRLIKWNNSILKGVDGEIIGAASIGEDITERKQAEEALRRMSTHDNLTGLYNRGYFVEELERLERGRKFPISIIMADVDYLKATNDQWGHAAGDSLLKRVAQVFIAAFRAEDVVARIGGDEFAVLLPNTDEAAVKISLERVQRIIQESNAAHNEAPIRISVGVSTAVRNSTSLANVLKQADANLYRVKRGRVST